MPLTVSVVIPVYNGDEYIRKCLDSLSRQTLPASQYEVIIVDNGSTDNSMVLAESYSVKIIKELKRGSYAARNTGIRNAQGSIIGFIDVDCIASVDWLKYAVNYFTTTTAVDILSGKVEFLPPERLTIWGDFDKNTFLNQEYSFKAGVAKTANLFVSSTVFETFGFFNDAIKSGGDVNWTAEAVSKGATIHYEPKAIVYHPVRNSFNEIVQKVFRVGTGKGQIIKVKKHKYGNSNLGLSHFKHPFKLLWSMIANKEKEQSFFYPVKMAFVIFVLALVFLSGIIQGFLVNKKN
ncbi:MAG: glycosyltransferase [Bacteroidales bacterium]